MRLKTNAKTEQHPCYGQTKQKSALRHEWVEILGSCQEKNLRPPEEPSPWSPYELMVQETDEVTPTLHWMCFPPWNSALHHVQKVAPTLNAHVTAMISCSIVKKETLKSAKYNGTQVAPYPKSHSFEPLVNRDFRGFAHGNATIMSSRVGLHVRPSWAKKMISWVSFLDYGATVRASVFVAFAFMLCAANCKVAFMLNFL